MNYFDRVLLFFYSFAVTLLLIVTVPVIAGWWTAPLKLLLSAPQRADTSIALWTSLALLIIVGFRLSYVCIKRKPSPKAVVHELKLGQVHITLPAIEGLVKKSVHHIDGIKEAKSRIIPTPAGIDIILTVIVTPDINIPQISEQIQQNVRDYILEVTGITTQNVKVMVENISTNRPRVE